MKLAPAPDEYAEWVEHLAVPHRAKRAYWHLMLSPDARPEVERGLEHDDPAVRRACCSILDHLADPSTFDLLLERLDDPDPEVRSRALHALACDRCKGDTCELPSSDVTLLRAIEMARTDPSGAVRFHAVGVVGTFAPIDEHARALIAEVQANDPDRTLRKKAGWFAPGGPRYEHFAREARRRQR